MSSNSSDPLKVRYIRPELYPKQEHAIFYPRDTNGNPARYSLIEAGTKTGKAQPLNALIYTDRGPIMMRDIRMGMRVLTVDGDVADVAGVYPQGLRPIYRVTFADGTYVEADHDHLWDVRGHRRNRILTTRELKNVAFSRLRRSWLPSIVPVAYLPRQVPLDPYLVGVLIGDGCLKYGACVSTGDSELLEAVRTALPPGHSLRHMGRYDWHITAGRSAAKLRERGEHISGILCKLGLCVGSSDKRVPEVYKYNSADVRLAILQGILDTDGWVDKKHGQPCIRQTSEMLARDIAELVQSLGGFVRTTIKPPGFYTKFKGGPRIRSMRCSYAQSICHEDAPSLFRLARKRDIARRKRRPARRMFRSVEFIGYKQAQCIEVAHPTHLYLTDGMVPTHNTLGCIAWMFEQALFGKNGQNYWWLAPVYSQAEVAYGRMKKSYPEGTFSTNDSNLTLKLNAVGSTIWFKSGEKPDNLYGEDVYAAVIDEASRMREESWWAIRSTITATRGPVRFIGNVKGRKNWFYALARKAEHGEPGMAYFKIIAADAIAAGILAEQEIEDAKRQMPEQIFRELFLAEPSDDGGNPFGLNNIANCVHQLSTEPAQCWGWDLAKSVDWTVGIALDKYGRVCRFDRFQKPWPETIEHIKRATGRLPALVDSTGVGDPVTDLLQKDFASNFEGFKFTSASKQQLMEGLAVAIQSSSVKFPDGVIRRELEDFEYEYTRTGVRYCIDASTPILKDNLQWIPVGTLEVGDGIVGFDEKPENERKTRCWRRAKVIATDLIERQCYRIIMADGTEFICSAEHLWLTANGNGPIKWLKTSELRGRHKTASRRYAPHRLIKVSDTWAIEHCYEAGYLAAAFDGEGSLSQLGRNDHDGRANRLTFAQRDNAMAAEVRKCLRRFNMQWSEYKHGGIHNDVINFGIIGGAAELLHFLGAIRPRRLFEMFDLEKLGTMWTQENMLIEAVEYIGNHEVVALGTTTKTFIANGYATHNSAPEGFHDDCVCALALAIQCRGVVKPLMRISDRVLEISAQRQATIFD